MKLSIIIPIYGVEKYIKKCAESFSAFYNDPEKEVIFVNDGTKDNSISILEEIVLGCTNVKIVHRSNGGLSAARNTGIENAIGEYLYFADSDDFIDADNFINIFENGYKTKSDIIIGDFYRVNEKSNLLESTEKYTLNVNEIQSDSWPFYLLNYRKISSVVWRCIYSKSVIDKYNLKFHEGVVYEDMEWTPIIFNKSKSVYYIGVKFYYYRCRSNSIMNSSLSEKKMYDALEICKSLIRFGNKQSTTRDIDFFYKLGLFVLISNIYKYDSSKYKDLWYLSSNVSKEMKNKSSKYRIITTLLFLLPNRVIKKILELKFHKP